MKFAINDLFQFVNELPKDLNVIIEQLINLGIEVESVSNIDLNDIKDVILEVAVPANRADLLSIIGIARELSIINNAMFTLPKIPEIISKEFPKSKTSEIINKTISNLESSSFNSNIDLAVEILAPKSCAKYLLAVIKNLKFNMVTPDWIKKILENANISLISPIVDLTNYVMLELGQPLHAFDLTKITNERITVRYALPDESIELLNGRKINLDLEDLVIADHKGAIALAGIMGGINSAISNTTHSILLECAYFEPIGIQKSVIRHSLLTDAAQRFSRHIDPNLPELALQRCCALLKDLSIFNMVNYYHLIKHNYLPLEIKLKLKRTKIKKVLGFDILPLKVVDILRKLGIKVESLHNNKLVGWQLTIPSWRQDLKIEEDIIEELARFVGYNNIKPLKSSLPLKFKKIISITSNDNFKQGKVGEVIDSSIHINKFNQELQFKNCLSRRGYQEIISYSFIDLKLTRKFYDQNYNVENFYHLKNPISENMNIMRPTLLPGLISTLIYNKNRQHSRVRIFEVGNIFKLNTSDISKFIINNNKYNHQFMEIKKIAGLVTGKMFAENWQCNHEMDFYKLKSDVIALIQMTYDVEEINFIAINKDPNLTSEVTSGLSSGLHPYQSAIVTMDNINLGFVGALHPELLIEFEIHQPVYIFELDLSILINNSPKLQKFAEISKLPAIRRDFSILIDNDIEVSKIKDIIYSSCGILLKELIFFDVYIGDKLPTNKKSIAFGIILQHLQRTLIEEEINEICNKIINNLNFIGAQLRN